ncbi:hypothetical protein B296_00032004 [Ensete ventricosum]|uniref:4-coumarate--CoA ligase n=1 Tax=Ensete ventricosum TaxID=4639 RepID=A0A427A0P3_ENSVE|nr:hypothetical protein B296_00032004 [Ensete ventricosum]
MISLASETQPRIASPIHQPVTQPQETIVFRSRLPDITISNHLPLHTYCFEKLPETSDAPCLISATTGKIYTFSETHLLCRKAAAGFSKLGIGHGDVVMVLLQNVPEFIFTFMGASMLGAVTTTANPFYTPADIFKQIKASGAKLVVTQSAHVDKLRGGDEGFPKIGDGLTVITADDPPEDCMGFSEVLDSNETAVPDVIIDPDDPVALPFSSGTTGLPKGVLLTHKSMVSSIAQQVDGENPNVYLKRDDVVLCVLPLFHIFALNSALLCTLRAGAATMLMPKFEIRTMLEGIQRHRVSVAAVVPPLVLALAKNQVVENYDLSSMRIILSGAAPLGKELEDALRMRVPQAILGQGYGMTEAGPVLSMCPAFAKQPTAVKSGSCGIIVRNAEMKVVDPDTGFSLGRNQPGEICIRGPQIMKGYLNDVDATSKTIDVDGWLHTGDVGYVDNDDEVFIVDRVKELIKYKGFQVVNPLTCTACIVLFLTHEVTPPSPTLLSSRKSTVLLSTTACFVLLSSTTVLSMTSHDNRQNDEAAGEVPVAFVVRAKDSAISEQAIKEFIAKQVINPLKRSTA